MKRVLIFLCCISQLNRSVAQCHDHEGNAYNVGTVITLDGVKKKCACIIDVPVGQPCNSAWVVVNPTVAVRPPGAPVSTPKPFANRYVMATDPIITNGFFQKSSDNTVLAVKFKGGLLVQYTAKHFTSFEDLRNTVLDIMYSGDVQNTVKMNYSGFGKSAVEINTPFTAAENNYRQQWANKEVFVSFQATLANDIISNDGQLIGFSCNVTQGKMTVGEKNTKSEYSVDPSDIEVRIYFERNLPTQYWYRVTMGITIKNIAENMFTKGIFTIVK